MALKKKVNKEEFAKLSDHFKGEYVEDGEGYRLDVEGEEDFGEMKRGKDREKQLRKDAEKERDEVKQKLAEIEGSDARKKGDIVTLEKSWKESKDKMEGEYKEKIGTLTGHIRETLVDNVAHQIASEISTAPKLLIPHIKSRLTADFDGDKPSTRVLDGDGKPSALTIKDLSQEFIANPEFSSIIIASKASGGAGRSSKTGSGAPSTGNETLDLSKATPQQLVAHLEAKNS